MKRPLRHELQDAIHARDRSLRMGWCQRKDYDQIRVSMGKAQTFLISYPAATDQQVREWCRKHMDDVCRIVPGNQPRRLARLIMDELTAKVREAGQDVVQLLHPLTEQH